MSLVIVRLGEEDDLRSLIGRFDEAGFTVPDHSNELCDEAGYGRRAYQVQVPEGTTSDDLEPLIQAKGGEILKIQESKEVTPPITRELFELAMSRPFQK